MKKFKVALISLKDGVYRIEMSNPYCSFEGSSEEALVAQCKAYCVEYYRQHPEEKIERRTIDFEVELPDD